MKPPPFLKGSRVVEIGNIHKQYSMYQIFWTHLQKQRLWKDPQYMHRKVAYMAADEPKDTVDREIFVVKNFLSTTLTDKN